MQEVNIFIATSIHGPARKNGSYLYILEYIRDGIPITRDGSEEIENATENQLALKALLEALRRLNCPCKLRIHLGCQHILNAMKNDWVRQWQENNWQTARGDFVKNMELWSGVTNQLRGHHYTFTNENHSYQPWMEQQLTSRQRQVV